MGHRWWVRDGDLSRPIEFRTMKGSGGSCFVCDGCVEGLPHQRLLESVTQYSKVSLPKKISGLVGDEFLVVVDPGDVLCSGCLALVNRMDKLEEDLLGVRSILTTYLSKKYNIDRSQIAGHSSGTENNNIVEYNDFSNLVDEDQGIVTEFYDLPVQESYIDKKTSLADDEVDASLFEICNPVLSPDQKKLYVCGFCNRQFHSRKTCKMHICRSHDPNYSSDQDQIKYVSCLSCKNTARENDDIVSCDSDIEESANLNMLKYVGNGHSQFVCNICGKCKSSPEDVEKHFGAVTQPTNISVCHVCGEQTSDESELQLHLESHNCDSSLPNEEKDVCTDLKKRNNLKSIECPNLPTPVTQQSKYSFSADLKSTQDSHKTDSENMETKNHYQLCGVEITSDEVLKEHLSFQKESNSEPQLFICSLCDIRFNSRIVLEKHIRFHSKEIAVNETETIDCQSFSNFNSIFKCDICDKEFPSDLKLKEHIIMHTAKVDSLQCEYCLEIMDKRYSLVVHMAKMHSNIKTTLLCPLCNKKTATRYALKKHVVKCHLVGRLQQAIREKYAEGLDLIENTKDSLISRSDVISTGKDEVISYVTDDLNIPLSKCSTLACGVCAFRCKNMKKMQAHLRLHSLKKLECPLCTETFDTTSNLTAHVESEHKITLNSDQCPHCLEDCGDMVDHLKQKHSEMYQHLMCFECETIFDSTSSLKEHTAKFHFNSEKNKNIMNQVNGNMAEELSLLDSEQDLEVSKEDVSLDEDVSSPLEEMEDTVSNCDTCPVTGIKIEMEEHNQTQGPACHICKKEYRSGLGLEKHLRTHSDKFLSVSCLFCPAKLHDKSHLRTHMREAHPIGKRPYCGHCDKYFTHRASYLRHKTTRHSSDMLCQICGKQFSVLRKYLHHKEYFHREELTCSYCKKEFKEVKKLKVHEYIHKRNEGKTYECDECDKTLKTASGLRFHKLTHTGNYPFFCEYCGRGFVSTHHLEEHVAKHTGEERFVCDVCGKRFQLYDTYHRHRNLHDNPYPKQCDICKQFFRNASRVAEHKRKVHTGERPYKCPFCPMTFNISSTYKVHLCIHTQKFPHNCSLCERGFTTRIKYATHLASKHGDFSLLNDKKPNYRQIFPENYV